MLSAKPRLLIGLEEYAEAFLILNASRQPGGAIPLSEIAAYCGLMKLDRPHEVVRLIRAMDTTFLEIARDRLNGKH